MRENIKCLLHYTMYYVNREERRDSVSLYNPMTIQDLYQLDPATPWLDHINNLLTKVRILHS